MYNVARMRGEVCAHYPGRLRTLPKWLPPSRGGGRADEESAEGKVGVATVRSMSAKGEEQKAERPELDPWWSGRKRRNQRMGIASTVTIRTEARNVVGAATIADIFWAAFSANA